MAVRLYYLLFVAAIVNAVSCSVKLSGIRVSGNNLVNNKNEVINLKVCIMCLNVLPHMQWCPQ